MELLSTVTRSLERNFENIYRSNHNKEAINQELIDGIAGDIKDIFKKYNHVNFFELVFSFEKASEKVAEEVIANSKVI